MMPLAKQREPWPRLPRHAETPFVLSDNPADHGLSAVEVACIEQAYEIRRREIGVALARPQPFRAVSWPSGFDWPTTVREQVKAMIAVPVLLLVGVVVMLMAPFEYASHRREVAREKTLLRNELAELRRPVLLRPLPDKTLLGLWRLEFISRRNF